MYLLVIKCGYDRYDWIRKKIYTNNINYTNASFFGYKKEILFKLFYKFGDLN